jgi:hypothetical protein
LIVRRILRPTAAAAAILAAAVIPAGCGSSSPATRSEEDELQEVVDLIKSAKPGEFLIQSAGSFRDGPYRFKPSGYVFRFEQTGAGGRLVVSLQSKPGSTEEPYQLLVDTTAREGSKQVSLTGRLYVDIVADGGYLLRFTPKR